jgi:SLT domain-containing protein
VYGPFLPSRPGQVYPPFSQEAIALFTQAAQAAGLPTSWASSPGLHNILARESEGVVGVPNYTYARRGSGTAWYTQIWDELRRNVITAASSATGLGQLLLDNVERYYPSGRNGIGNPLEEAIGMLRYIKARYGSPDNAWSNYGHMGFEGY